MSLDGIRKAVLNVEPYVPGKTTEEVICEKGLSNVIKLGSNENPYGPFPAALEYMEKELVKLNTYPDVSFKKIKDAIAGLYRLKGENICISHGAEGMLQTLGKTFIEPGDEVLIPVATYPLYSEISKLMGADIIRIPMKDNFYIDMASIRKAVSSRTKLIWLNNPNNPTGTMFRKESLDILLEEIPTTCWIVLDEAYAEFADPDNLPDISSYIEKGKNIVSVRTFSKAYALAGARVGYALCRKEIATIIDTVSEPFNANRVGIAGALATLQKDMEECKEAISKIRAERMKLFDAFEEMGLDPVQSQSNFIFVTTPLEASVVTEALLDRGIIIRPCSGWGYSRSIRITVGTPDENSSLLRNFTSVLDQLRKDD